VRYAIQKKLTINIPVNYGKLGGFLFLSHFSQKQAWWRLHWSWWSSYQGWARDVNGRDREVEISRRDVCRSRHVTETLKCMLSLMQ